MLIFSFYNNARVMILETTEKMDDTYFFLNERKKVSASCIYFYQLAAKLYIGCTQYLPAPNLLIISLHNISMLPTCFHHASKILANFDTFVHLSNYLMNTFDSSLARVEYMP